jgi:DNA-binding GntR family transcriptional regulator
MFNRHPSKTDDVYDVLLKKLILLEVTPGKIYSENQINEIVDTGRTPLREALLRLEIEGFVEMIPRRGILINEHNISDILSILDTSRVLDELLTTRACRRAKNEQRQTFQTLAKKIEDVAHKKTYEQYLNISDTIDQLTGSASRNFFAYESVRPLRALWQRFLSFSDRFYELPTIAEMQADVVFSIISKEEPLAREAVNRLYSYYMDFSKKVFDM